MKERTYIYFAVIQAVILILTANVQATEYWEAPFDTAGIKLDSNDSTLSLNEVLMLVATENPSFQSFSYQIRAAQGDLKQAGIWSNPEFGAEFEEVGWDAPGFKESEFSISLDQEFELFGQRGARKKAALTQIDATKLRVKLSAFDLYLNTKQRYYTLAHAQQNVKHSQQSVDLANEIVESINYKLNKGAALQSELLLAQLDEQRAQLALDQSIQDVIAIEAVLVSLWKAKPSGLKVTYGNESDFQTLFEKITLLSNDIDVTRDIIQMQSELDILGAEKAMSIAEARPTVTLSGGFKRIEFDKSKTFLFGVSLPIPLFDRNQGKRQSLIAQMRSLDYDIEQRMIEANSLIQFHTIRLKKSIERHDVLDSLLLPTAGKVYRMLQKAYEAGRVSYTQLLEAKRALNDLNFERNDMILEIQEHFIALEGLTGVALLVKKEK